jgi:hypothetical protein
MDPATRVGDSQRVIVPPHRAGANRVVVVLDGGLDPVLQRLIVLDRRSWGQLRAEKIA